MREDLREAAIAALLLSREDARARAALFDWAPVCDQFIGFLVAVRHGSVMSVMKPKQKIHKLVA